jgi:acetyl esterase/lipase
VTDFGDRLDPALQHAVEASPVMDITRDLPKLREVIERFNAPLRAALPQVPEVTVSDHDAGGVRVRTYSHADRAPGSAALLWIHGGGMVVGTIDADDFTCKSWAKRYGCLVASVDYRLAPEHPYPAHVDDCYAALQWLVAQVEGFGIDPARIAIGGASAGGGLAAATAIVARDRGEVPLCFQYLQYPMLDDRGETASTREITCPNIWNGTINAQAWAMYLGDRVGRADVPLYAAPARATLDDLRGLPPAYIDVGELDPFRDEDIGYATKLLQAGVPCELHVTPGAYHASEATVPNAPSSRAIHGYRRDVLARVLS